MGGLLGILEFKINLRLSQSLGHLLRTQLAQRILSLPMSKLDEQRIGDSTYRVIYDSTAAVWIFHEITLSLYSGLLLLGMAIGIMLTTYGNAPLVIVVGLAVAPMTFLLSIPVAPLVRRVSASSRTSGSETTSNIEEGMSNVLAIQSLGTNKQESRRFSDASAESFKRYRFLRLARALMGIGGMLAFLLGQISFFVLMSGHVIEGTYTAGDYFVVLYYYFVISAVSYVRPRHRRHLHRRRLFRRSLLLLRYQCGEFFLRVPVRRLTVPHRRYGPRVSLARYTSREIGRRSEPR
jgi:ABC-type multidrug transport system fused ATPase/permease subunit